MTIASRPFFAERKRIVELAVKYRLPAIYFQKEFVDEGGSCLMELDYDDLYRRAATYVDKILEAQTGIPRCSRRRSSNSSSTSRRRNRLV